MLQLAAARGGSMCAVAAHCPQQRRLQLPAVARQQRPARLARRTAIRASLTDSSEEQQQQEAPSSPPSPSSKSDIKQTMADLDALLGIEPEKEEAQQVGRRDPAVPLPPAAASTHIPT